MIQLLPLDREVEAILDRLKRARSRQDVEICVEMITATPSTRWQYLLDLEEMAALQRSILFEVLHQRRDEVVDAVADGEVIYIHDYSESEVRERYPQYRSQN